MQTPVPQSSITVGCELTAHNLKARPDLNGKNAVAIAFVESSGRWRVRFNSGEEVALKPSNLKVQVDDWQPLPDPDPRADGLQVGAGIQLHGLKGRPDLNGKKGLVIQHLPEKDRWRIIVEDSAEEVSIKTGNLKLKHYIHFGDALDGPPGPATAKKAKRAHVQQVPSHDSMARSKGKEPSRVGAAADETVIDRATGARMTAAQLTHLEQKRKREVLQRHDNKGLASRKRSAVLVMGESQSTKEGRTKKLLERTLAPKIDATQADMASNAKDGGTVDWKQGTGGGISVSGAHGMTNSASVFL